MKSSHFVYLLFFILFSCAAGDDVEIPNEKNLPFAPTDLVGELTSVNQITLTWVDNSTNETGFKIERKEGNNQFLEIGTVNSNITSYLDNGLNPNSTYTYRVYAYNEDGNSLTYSNLVVITTPDPITVPEIYTNDVIEISYTSAICGGNVTSNGGAEITERGVVWGTAPNPTIDLDTKTVDGSGIGEFTSNISDLIDGMEYYVRAYATNSKGTSYGSELTFSTLEITLPEVNTVAISDVTSTTIKSGGIITSNGGAEVTQRGVVWGTAPNPTIDLDTKTVDGSGIGEFISQVEGLSLYVEYNIRAYATNSKGTAYGETISFVTSYAIGETGPAGGFIFYDKGYHSNGWRYLEANNTDYSTEGVVWWNGTWNYNNSTGISPKSDLGDGKENTLLIIEANNYLRNAAKVCNDFSKNGYNDWYLPSIGELQLMCQNLFSEGIGNFEGYFYWSSTDTNRVHNAHWIQFPNNENCEARTDSGRNMENLVRPIRQF